MSQASTHTFITNVNCAACVAKVSPYLNAVPGLSYWHVDTTHPDKLLHTQGHATPKAILRALAKAGYIGKQRKGLFGLLFGQLG